MLISPRLARLRVGLVLPLLLLTTLFWFSSLRATSSHVPEGTLEQRFPLAWKHIKSFKGTGGAWYIPPEWMSDHESQPQNILEAAQLVSKVASLDPTREIPFSNIPLIVHQTWKTSQISTWNVEILSWVEIWLKDATATERGRPMAYLFWDDDGIMTFMQHYEKDFVDSFMSYFTPVERADIFRILVCKWLGGIYADVDTEPLRHPSAWINQSDISPWTDPETGISYGVSTSGTASNNLEKIRPVNLLWGLEADTDPASSTHWRMGYTYPIQLTQWALASAQNHPVLTQFMEQLNARLRNETSDDLEVQSIKADPLTRTGPAAVTLATMTWLESQIGFRWNALTGLKDGGKAKLVSDVLVLPITGFSPGRGSYGNMGSKPASDPAAKLYHHARGSWRHFNLKVEYGKFCRTMFGLCKDWPKVA
ncbi:glycosyltransferase family 32 protein [Mariannaea sp. PMI_226]|nr:glycosyltransferase family 32 protein [Mariannaea sp. PMI_226]